MKDVAKLVRNLMESTCVYTSARIENEKDRSAYIKAMRRCYYICSEECNGNQLSRMLNDLTKLQNKALSTFIRRFEIFSDVKKHYMLGIHQSLDIVRCIGKRFITGHSSDPDTTNKRGILGGNDEV